jgi:hypothetical protein
MRGSCNIPWINPLLSTYKRRLPLLIWDNTHKKSKSKRYTPRA